MSNKTEAAYKAVFEYIHTNILPLMCKSFMCDYERAMRNGFVATVSEARTTACDFHFTQACKKNAVKYPTMIQLIHSKPEAAKIYYKLLALPLLPAHAIRDAFAELKEQALAMSPAFNKFLIYFYRQWIEGKRVSISREQVNSFNYLALVCILISKKSLDISRKIIFVYIFAPISVLYRNHLTQFQFLG